MKCFVTLTGLALVLSVAGAPQLQPRDAVAVDASVGVSADIALPTGAFPHPPGGFHPSDGFPHPTGTGHPHPKGTGSPKSFDKRNDDTKGSPSKPHPPGGIFPPSKAHPSGVPFTNGTGPAHHEQPPH